MNYANMIEEKNLKKTFIIATLCSTLVGTFTSSMGLYDRVSQKRQQHKKDSRQDDEIKKLREQVENAEKRSQERESQPRLKDRDDVGANFERSMAMIQRQYDIGYDRFGSRFGVGDAITENRLQAQIISLQQTVIQVLQDAAAQKRDLTNREIDDLNYAINATRDNSIDALRQQQQRLASDGGSPQRALPPPKRASTIIESDPLYCRYSLDLQYIKKKPLSADFAPGGVCRCPDCGLRLDVTADDFWQIKKVTQYETREFHVGQRFVIKCHTPDGEYACVLCNKHRDVDALCRSVDSLIKHVGNFHDIGELEREFDLREEFVAPLGLPPPPAPAPPMVSRRVEEVDVRAYR